MSLIDKIFVFLFSVLLFSSLYVSSTMNALHNDYIERIDDFKTPFYIVKSILALFLIIISILCCFSSRIKDQNLSLFRAFGVAAIIVPILISVIGYAPCMYVDVYPHTELKNVIKQSLFCPSYSIRSYVWLVLLLILGLVTLGCSNIREIKNFCQKK